MRVNGLIVDADAIGAGLYEIICKTGRAGIVAVGMIPNDVIEMVRPMLREKVIEEAAKQIPDCTAAELKASGFLSEDKIRATVQTIETAICSAIYSAAAARGRMIV